MDELQELYDELREVERFDGEYPPKYNGLTKKEVVRKILQDIAKLKEELESAYYDYAGDELEEERLSLCRSQGLSRYF